MLVAVVGCDRPDPRNSNPSAPTATVSPPQPPTPIPSPLTPAGASAGVSSNDLANLYDASNRIKEDLDHLADRPPAALKRLADFNNGRFTEAAGKEYSFLRTIAHEPDSAAVKAVRDRFVAALQREATTRLAEPCASILTFAKTLVPLGDRINAFREHVRRLASRPGSVSQPDFDQLVRERVSLAGEYTRAKEWMDAEELQLSKAPDELIALVERLGREAEDKVNPPAGR